MERVVSYVLAGAVGLLYAEAFSLESLRGPSPVVSKEGQLMDDEYENVLNENVVKNRGFVATENPVDRFLSWVSFHLRLVTSMQVRHLSRKVQRSCHRFTTRMLNRARLYFGGSQQVQCFPV